MGLARGFAGHSETCQRAQTSSHDQIWLLRGTLRSEQAVVVPINNMHDICVFVGQIRPQHDSRLVVPLAALSKLTENCGWIDLSCHQHEICCPASDGNVVNLRFCGCCSPQLCAFENPEKLNFQIPRDRGCQRFPARCLSPMFDYIVTWVRMSRLPKICSLPHAKRSVHFCHFHYFLLPQCCLFWRNFV